MEIVYRLRIDEIYDDEGELHTVYGVDACDGDGNILESISDIFLEREKAEGFIGLCNSLSLSLVHLYDVIEDVLI